MDKKLYMNFWNYDNFDGNDVKHIVKEWKDAEFNLGMTFLYYGDPQTKAEVLKMLDECQANGMQTIVCDYRTHFNNLIAKGEKEFRKDVECAVRDFGSHPATFAFYVGDEPTKAYWEGAKNAVKIVNELSPVPAFINFLPYWEGDDYLSVMGCDSSEYEAKLDAFVKESGLNIVAYDCYACMNTHFKKMGLDMYYKNLAIFTRVARNNDLPCWCSSLCMGHWDYRAPTLEDMRWQVNTALAYGITGIQWFAVFDKKRDPNDCEILPLNAPYNDFGERTKTWYDMRDVNYQTLARFSDVVPNLNWQHSWHYGEVYAETRYWYDGVDDTLIHFSTTHKDNALISKFKDNDGCLHYFFVNTSQEVSNQICIRFTDKYAKFNKKVWLPIGHAYWIKLN